MQVDAYQQDIVRCCGTIGTLNLIPLSVFGFDCHMDVEAKSFRARRVLPPGSTRPSAFVNPTTLI